MLSRLEVEALIEHFDYNNCDCEHSFEVVELLRELILRREKIEYDTMLRIRRRQNAQHIWWPGFLVDPFRRCSHLNVMSIRFRNYRFRCLDCGRMLKDMPQKRLV